MARRQGRRALSTRNGAPWPVVAGALALALASILVAAAVLVGRGPEATGKDDLREEALEAARAAAVSLTTYDHRTLEEDFARVAALATGAFAEEYARTSANLGPALQQTQAVATSEVPAAGIERLEPDPVEVVVVLAVDQVIATAGAQPRTELNRIRMTLVRPEGTWLVSAVERL